MTLGLNLSKFNIFNKLTKSESKKRSFDEVVNGLPEDNNPTTGFGHNHNNHSYESENKRLRREMLNEVTTSDTKLNTNNQNNCESISVNDMPIWEKVWHKVRGNNGKQDKPTDATTSGYQINEMVVNNTTENTRFSSNATTSNSFPLFSSDPHFCDYRPSNMTTKTVKKKSKLIDLSEKFKYKQLIARHMKFGNKQSDNKKLSTKTCRNPEIIDLTSETSITSIKSVSTYSAPVMAIQSKSLHFDSKQLDKSDSNVNLTQRIVREGFTARAPTIKLNKSNNTPFGMKSFQPIHSTPKISNINDRPNDNLFKQTPHNVTPLTQSLEPMPESSKIFKDMVSSKEEIFTKEWIRDFRKNLTDIEKNEFKTSKCEEKVVETNRKRIEDSKSLRAKVHRPINRTELNPFIPFYEIDEEDEDIDDEEEEETALVDMPVLTPEMDKEIDSAFKAGPNVTLVESSSGPICRRDIETLKGLNWLNDEIINFYLTLIVERGKNDNYSSVHAFNTFFYKKLKDSGPQSLKRWTRKVDIFANDFVFIPIHLGMHWCLAVINFKDKCLQYYDSMGGNNDECLQLLKAYVQTESLDKKKVTLDMSDWNIFNVKNIPQQENGSDCGMFSCKYAEYISRNAKINFSQSHMPYFRRRMVYEILNKRLL
ncbi:sentrin-specific protease 1-like [Oppia nitens]|uniref:sentrin-specific protease 1-like n=1 Tax=Oppia nitens TaxID=1686743 RepID=UPI0023DAACC4|nr:sentrin-specific protease 1-like [Oppia nitens]